LNADNLRAGTLIHPLIHPFSLISNDNCYSAKCSLCYWGHWKIPLRVLKNKFVLWEFSFPESNTCTCWEGNTTDKISPCCFDSDHLGLKKILPRCFALFGMKLIQKHRTNLSLAVYFIQKFHWFCRAWRRQAYCDGFFSEWKVQRRRREGKTTHPAHALSSRMPILGRVTPWQSPRGVWGVWAVCTLTDGSRARGRHFFISLSVC